jgi:hypothetical protein
MNSQWLVTVLLLKVRTAYYYLNPLSKHLITKEFVTRSMKEAGTHFWLTLFYNNAYFYFQNLVLFVCWFFLLFLKCL